MGALVSSNARIVHRTVGWMRTVGTRGLEAMRSVTDVTRDTTAPSTSERWMEEEFLCPCYYTDNFFVRSLGRHVTYDGTAAGFDAAPVSYTHLTLPTIRSV